MASSPSAFLVWGGGGHGRMVGDLILATGNEVAGYVDRDRSKVGSRIDPTGSSVTYLEEDLLALLEESGRYPDGADASALGIGDNGQRERCIRELEGLAVPALVHPSAHVSPAAKIGRGTVVFPHAVVNAGAEAREAVIVNSGAVIEHDCLLGTAVHVSPGATLCGGVRVGPRSWIGAGSTVIQGVEIGEDVTVGAGSTVLGDVPDGATVVGSPAKAIRS